MKTKFTAIVSPAVGGIVPGYEMGRQLGLPAMYVERVDGEFQLRRNFTLKKSQKVLMVEDIVSTGVSSARMHRRHQEDRRQGRGRLLPDRPLRRQGQGRRAADRAGGMESAGLASRQAAAASANIPAVKPGSRGLA